MQTQSSLIEPIVIGTGTLLLCVIAAFHGFAINPSLAEYNDLLTELVYEFNWIMIFPLVAIIYLLGISMDELAALIFRPWENYLRKNTLSPKTEGAEKSTVYYFKIRNFLYSTDQTRSIVESISVQRSRIRICRAWALISILILVSLVILELTQEFDPYRFPLIVLFSLMLLLTLVGWLMGQDRELKWMEPFK